MLISKTHKIRLKPNNKQKTYFAKACGCARFTYNWALAEWKSQYEAGSKPSPYALNKQFTVIKKQEYPWIMEVTKCAPERAFMDLGKAFSNFFRNVKAGKKPGYPKFKKKGIKNSFYISNKQFDILEDKVRIPKLGWVRMCESLRFEGKIMSATVSETAGNWFISVQVEQEIPDPIPTGPVVGIDVGIKELAVVSDGRVFNNPKALKQHEKRLRMLHKSLSRKQKGSKNRIKAKLKLAKQYYRISCIRQDALHKATAAITKCCSVIGIETLNIKGMLKNRKLSKALSDASISEFLRQIEYKSEWRNIAVVKADRFFPSSKTCSNCGSIKTNLTLADRIYKCECGLQIDRDLNAAINLKNMAVGSTATACCLGSSGSSAKKSETTNRTGNSCNI